ncbi:MEKHLA domain-containing protein [Chelativorans sp. YIM 93263]|uniref:MEKHLA domain-containing protein n=1 Tax=Chelativorans sp. YIM 93263 TaxID=2906648 RepID=UPI002379210B|nr:MEKHLA domain-containing protein [Chelativorans sp. YIM 93263]
MKSHADEAQQSPILDYDFFEVLVESHVRLVGRSFLPPDATPDWLYYNAPFAVLAHGTGNDPVFAYANKTAQHCFEYTWDDITVLPSRLSAEAPERAERERLLEAVSRQGYIENYRGIRVARSGRRFEISDGVVWQLIDQTGTPRGQAARFSSWQDLPLP